MTNLSRRNFWISRVSTVSTVLAVLFISHFSVPAFGVRFQMEEDGMGVRRTVYPEAVRNVSQRSSEVLQFLSAAPLAANFPYLHLTDLVKQGSAYNNYLATTAEVLISQAPEELRLPLRQMYFEGRGVVETPEVWRVNSGRRLQRASFSVNEGEARVHVETVEGLKDSPLIRQTVRLMSIIEITQQAAAVRHFPAQDSRLYFPVLDMVTKITTALFMEETIGRMGNQALVEEASRYEGNPALRSTLVEHFSGAQMNVHAMDWVMENRELKGDLLLEWVNKAREKRDLQNRSIKGLSQVDVIMDQLVRLELATELERSPGRQFEMTRKAREQGDRRKSRLLVGQVVVIGGAGRCDLAFRPQ